MATIKNYYEELGLDPEMSIEEIGSKLDHLENVWNQRLINAPERANRILSIIREARETFLSPEAKSEYNRSLQETKKSIQDGERKKNFNRWYELARKYFEDQQDDLAKAAIDKAASYYDQADENATYLSYAADIYRMNKEYDAALRFVNEACLYEPDNWVHISVKGAIYNSTNQYDKAYGCFKKAIQIAYSNGDSVQECQSQGHLASVLFYGLNDIEGAQIAAKRAIELGDYWRLGQRILYLCSFSPGAYVQFGHYKQEANGAEKPIYWEIMEVKDQLLFLVSKFALDVQAFKDNGDETTWAQSSIRKWLNGEFLNCAFGNQESTLIINANVRADPCDDFLSESNQIAVDQGPDTIDKVFLLSLRDAMTLMDANKRFCIPTKYCTSKLEQDHYFYKSWATTWSIDSISKSGHCELPLRTVYQTDNRGTFYERDSGCSYSYYAATISRQDAHKLGGSPMKHGITVCPAIIVDMKGRGFDESLSLVSADVIHQEMANNISFIQGKNEKGIKSIWKSNGKCQYCGGELKGLFNKKCSICGKPKDY